MSGRVRPKLFRLPYAFQVRNVFFSEGFFGQVFLLVLVVWLIWGTSSCKRWRCFTTRRTRGSELDPESLFLDSGWTGLWRRRECAKGTGESVVVYLLLTYLFREPTKCITCLWYAAIDINRVCVISILTTLLASLHCLLCGWLVWSNSSQNNKFIKWVFSGRAYFLLQTATRGRNNVFFSDIVAK